VCRWSASNPPMLRPFTVVSGGRRMALTHQRAFGMYFGRRYTADRMGGEMANFRLHPGSDGVFYLAGELDVVFADAPEARVQASLNV
jgi:hypothetical protein